jgi:hypothetical protein
MVLVKRQFASPDEFGAIVSARECRRLGSPIARCGPDRGSAG